LQNGAYTLRVYDNSDLIYYELLIKLK
jgi:hypothetical protein